MTRLRRYDPVPGSGIAAHCRPIHTDSVAPPEGFMISLEELAVLFEAAKLGQRRYILDRPEVRLHFEIGFGTNQSLYVVLRNTTSRDDGTTEGA